jgi:hypothetical protein
VANKKKILDGMVDVDLHSAPNWDSIEENEDTACDLGYDYDWIASDDSDDGMFLYNLIFDRTLRC